LDLEIPLSGASAKVQPHGLLPPGQRRTETSDDVIEEDFAIIAAIGQALSYASERRETNEYHLGFEFQLASADLQKQEVPHQKRA
jgi:hypothetical protein